MLSQKGYLADLLQSSPSQSGGSSSLAHSHPDATIPTKTGWCQGEVPGRRVYVTKDPLHLFTPGNKIDPNTWKYRTTWVLVDGKWNKIEDQVRYPDLANPKADIRPIAQRAVFVFHSLQTEGLKWPSGGNVSGVALAVATVRQSLKNRPSGILEVRHA
jgi:hypothetical protein